MNICEYILSYSRTIGDNTAILFEDYLLSYAALEHESACAAQQLIERGIKRGDRVGIVASNTIAFAIWYYATLRVGAIAVAVNTRLSANEVEYILSDSGVSVVVVLQDLLELVSESDTQSPRQQISVLPDGRPAGEGGAKSRDKIPESACEDMQPSDPATILYTSGTTGFPKGATLSHRNVRSTMHAHNHLNRMRTSDRILLSVPLFHCYGQNTLLNSTLNVGATIVLQKQFDIEESRQLIKRNQVTKLFLVPTTFQLLLEYCQPDDLESIEYCFSAAAILPHHVGKGWQEKFGMPIYEGYGLTESSPFASYNHNVQHIPGSIGTPVDLVEMKVVDLQSGVECRLGELGEIAIRGPNVMLGYWNRPEETEKTIRDSWLMTGDIGRKDEKGYFYIVDRVKDMISVGASKVYPAEVERVLLDLPSVNQAAVVGHPDEIMGEQVIAFLVAESGKEIHLEHLRNHCQSSLASYKTPAHFFILDELPKNPAGKILKRTLKELRLDDLKEVMAAEEPLSASAREINNEAGTFADKLREIHKSSRLHFLTLHLQEELASLLELSIIPDPNATIMELGMDSLAMVDLRDRLQAQAGPNIELEATLVFNHPRISDLAAHLLSLLDDQSTSANLPQSEETKATNSHNQNQPQPIEEMSEQSAMDALLRELQE